MGFKCQQNFSHPVGLPTPRHVFSFPFHGLFTSSLLLFEKFKGKAEIQASRAGRMNLQLNNSEIRSYTTEIKQARGLMVGEKGHVQNCQEIFSVSWKWPVVVGERREKSQATFRMMKFLPKSDKASSRGHLWVLENNNIKLSHKEGQLQDDQNIW